MGRIRVLADPLINRIAAGEVVERPASVVKELVENSLDAAAGSVEVVLRGGGRQSIRVSDDGCGMDRDDALLAVERHATSKLREASDLDAIATLGFRGEALASIAAVSRFTLETAIADGEGTSIEVHGGRIRDVRQAGLPRGTSVRVDRLFCNVPVRRKFLKRESTELSHVVRWLTRFALAYPRLRFVLRHGERTLIETAPTRDTLQRIAQIYGREFADKLLPLRSEEPGLRIHGYAGRPVDSLPRRDAQHVFVNGRAVQDRVLTHAVTAGYGNTMVPGRHPAVFLFVDIDPKAVDVNVHPQKTEVRFREAARVHDRVRDGVVAVLSAGGAVASLTELRPAALGDEPPGVRRATLGYLETHEGRPAPGGVYRLRPSEPEPSRARGHEDALAVSTDRATPSMSGPSAENDVPPPQVVALAQFRDSYIVAEDADGLVLVDQHAAQERVLFERFLRDAQANQVEVQRLMFPVTLELTPHEAVLLEQEIDEFRRLGFTVEPFGENAARLDGIPSLVGEVDVEGTFRELLGAAAEAKAAAADVDHLRRRLVTTASCKAAIKVNYTLNRMAMQQLLDDLHRAVNPTTCPHGRPILFRLTLAEIERAFRRR